MILSGPVLCRPGLFRIKSCLHAGLRIRLDPDFFSSPALDPKNSTDLDPAISNRDKNKQILSAHDFTILLKKNRKIVTKKGFETFSKNYPSAPAKCFQTSLWPRTRIPGVMLGNDKLICGNLFLSCFMVIYIVYK